MASFLLQVGIPILGSLSFEEFYLRKVAAVLYKGKPVPKGFSSVILVNIIGSGFMMVYLGFKVASLRKKCIESAEKAGDENATDRYSYPKIYAEGFSETAKEFNCVQRSHQQALETYPIFLATSLVGGFRYPLTSALGGLYWIYARLKWAEGYRTGDPSKRYSHWASKGIWTGLLVQLTAAAAASIAYAFANE